MKRRTPFLWFLPCSLFVAAWACSDSAGNLLPAPTADASTTPAADAAPSTEDGSVDAGEDAEPYSGPAPYDGGPMVAPVMIDLGVVQSDTPISFTVPQNALGFHVVVESAMTSENLDVKSIQAPSGTFFHQNGTPAGGNHGTSQTLLGKTASAQVPQGAFNNETVEAGSWKVVFQGGGTLRAKVQIQATPDGVFHGGNLNLNVFVPGGLKLGGGTSITAKNAYASSEVRTRIDGLFEAVYALYGFRNGTVRFFDIDSKFRVVEDNDLFTLFKETKAAPSGQAVNIFLSEGSEDSTWWGISAGVPGAANMPGNDQSGLALASFEQATGDMEAFVLAHELGHFLGLNHTTELQGDNSDPLPDTPVCVGIEGGDLENCPDFTNIMFASGASMPPVVSSKSQRRVVRGSPMIQAFAGGTPPPVLLPVLPGSGHTNPSAFDFGRLFGHPGSALSRGERLVLASACGHVSHRTLRVPARDRADVLRVANDARTAAPVRGIARKLLARTTP